MNALLLQMKTLAAAAFAVVFLVIIAAHWLRRSGASRRGGTFAPRQPLSKNEQAMFWRLTAAMPQPEFVVLAEVSFGALLQAKQGASHFSFTQKRADFLVLDKSFTVIAIIELDDASHRGKEAKDQARDVMLTAAGYRVLRYKVIPDTDRIRADLLASTTS